MSLDVRQEDFFACNAPRHQTKDVLHMFRTFEPRKSIRALSVKIMQIFFFFFDSDRPKIKKKKKCRVIINVYLKNSFSASEKLEWVIASARNSLHYLENVTRFGLFFFFCNNASATAIVTVKIKGEKLVWEVAENFCSIKKKNERRDFFSRFIRSSELLMGIMYEVQTRFTIESNIFLGIINLVMVFYNWMRKNCGAFEKYIMQIGKTFFIDDVLFCFRFAGSTTTRSWSLQIHNSGILRQNQGGVQFHTGAISQVSFFLKNLQFILFLMQKKPQNHKNV